MRKPILSSCRLAASAALVLLLGAAAGSVRAQGTPDRAVVGTNVKNYANAVLAIMSYTAVLDVTTSSLSINCGTSGNPAFGRTQLLTPFHGLPAR